MKHKEHLLIILSRFPYPLEKGDKLRAYYQIKELAKSYRITLVAVSDRKISNEQQDELKKYCDKIIIGRINLFTKLTHSLLALLNGKPFQVGYFFRSSIKNKIKSIIKSDKPKHIYCQLIRTAEYVKNIHHIPKTIDYMDALSSGINKRVSTQPFYNKWIYKLEGKKLATYERHIFDYFENHTIISEQDRELIGHPDKYKITCIPNGIDEAFFKLNERPEKFDFVFVGNLNYPPNIDAVTYIINQILPQIKNATLLVSGATPHSSVVKICNSHDRVTLTGWVDDIRTSYVNAKIFLAPMMIGTGMQNKLLEAMALKTPSITTSLANDAINAINEKEILVGNNQKELINHCKELLLNESRRNSIGFEASNMVKKNFSWKHSTELLKTLFENKSK